MKKNTANNIRLGLFITVGTIALIVALYLIGSNRNIFGNTIKIHSHFFNVNGLRPGNNVRYAGIDIGTVDKIVIENDSSVTVYMIIEKNQSDFIKKNSVAAIGTDGLMGNKLVNINPGEGKADPIENGDEIPSLRPVETDEMVRTLNTTNENLEVITGDLRKFTSRLNKDKGVLKLIEDSITTENIRQAMMSIRDAAENANRITLQLNQLAEGLNRGDGLAGVLLKDEKAAEELRSTIHNLQMATDSINEIASGLGQFSEKLNNPNNVVTALTSDTMLTQNVKNGLNNLEQSTVLLNENLKAMRRSFLFRKYFKEQEKKQNK